MITRLKVSYHPAEKIPQSSKGLLFFFHICGLFKQFSWVLCYKNTEDITADSLAMFMDRIHVYIYVP